MYVVSGGGGRGVGVVDRPLPFSDPIRFHHFPLRSSLFPSANDAPEDPESAEPGHLCLLSTEFRPVPTLFESVSLGALIDFGDALCTTFAALAWSLLVVIIGGKAGVDLSRKMSRSG